MYYNGHLAAAEKDIGSRNFCNLVDAAVLLYEEEEEVRKLQSPSRPLQLSLSSLCPSKTSRKRRAVQERERGNFKKATVPHYSWKERATPEWLVDVIKSMEESKGERISEGPWPIYEKKLTKTDIMAAQSRLLMPFKSLLREDFLTCKELEAVARKDENNGVGAILVDPRKKKWGLILMRREMMKGSGNGTSNYALICGWNDVVQANGLKEDDDISVWYFRWRRCLCFALVRPPPDMAAVCV